MTDTLRQATPKWQPWEHRCGFVLLMRMAPDLVGDGERPEWLDDFENWHVIRCPKCGDPLDLKDGG